MTQTKICLSNHSKQGRTNGTKTQQNGARAKILRALANADCGLTTAELAESAGLTASQVRDNAGVAKKAGLLTIEQDEMTRFVTYNISQKGRIARQKTAARQHPHQLALGRATRPTWFRGPIRQQTKALLQI